MNLPSFPLFRFLTALELSSHSLLTMSQQTMFQLASLASRPDPAADTLAHYQALPVSHHQLEEAAYLSGALGVDDVVGWAAGSSYGYSNPMGYQTLDFRLLWTNPTNPQPPKPPMIDLPPPPSIRLVDKWKMGKYGTSENVRRGGKHRTPPPPACFES